MAQRTHSMLVMAAAVALILAQAVSAQGFGGGLLGPQDGNEGGRVTEMRLEPAQQAAGGAVLVVARVVPAEGYKVGQDTVSIDLEADLVLAAREVVIRQEGRVLPATQEYVEGPFEVVLPADVPQDAATGEYTVQATVRYVPCTVDGNLCLMQHQRSKSLTLEVVDGPVVPVEVASAEADEDASQEVGAAPDDAEEGDPFAGRSAWVAILVAFAVGFALLLTPCIYPLIPVTVALVGATAERSWWRGLLHSVVYVLGISVTYAVAGGVAGVTGSWFDWLQHPAVSVALALVFVAMALAMFDVFTVDLSSQRLQRMRARLQGRGGMAGLFGIGILTGVGATACVAPVIVSALTYVGREGNPVLGMAMFFAMAWGFGLPLVALGTFTGLAKAAPRPGEWMNVVKHLLGLALLGVALYYVGKSGVLPDQVFRLVLVAFLLGAGVFVGAFDRLSLEDGWYPRARKTLGLLLVGAAVVFFAEPYLARVPAGPAMRKEVDWVELEPGAEVQYVAEANMPVLVDYWTEDCAACKKMMRTTFVDAAVVAESERFVFAKVDMTDVDADSEVGRQFRATYEAAGYPVVGLYDSEGRLVEVLTGYVGPEEMVRVLKTVE